MFDGPEGGSQRDGGNTKASIRRGLISAAVTAAVLSGIAVPAEAVTVKTGGGSCSMSGGQDSSHTYAYNTNCTLVQARITYIDSGGTNRTSYGAQTSGTSTATSQTLMVVGRAVQAKIGGYWSGWFW